MVKALLQVYWFTVAMHQLLRILSEFEAPTNRKERNTYGKIKLNMEYKIFQFKLANNSIITRLHPNYKAKV